MRGVPGAPAIADQLPREDIGFGFVRETRTTIHNIGEHAEWQEGLEGDLLDKGEWWGIGEIGKRPLMWDKNIRYFCE